MNLTVTGASQVQKMFQAKAEQYKAGAVVVTGYACEYATHVHENLEQKWKGLPRSADFTRDSNGVVRVPRSIFGGKIGTRSHGFYWGRPSGSQGKPRFLSDPFLRLRRELVATIAAVLRLGQPVGDAIYAAGMLLQVASQEEVPIDSGRLHHSAFTRRER